MTRRYWFCDSQPLEATLARRIEVALAVVERRCLPPFLRRSEDREETEGRALIDGLYRAAGVMLAEGRHATPEAAILRQRPWRRPAVTR